MNKEKLQKNYATIVSYLMSKSFRVPMKQFIDSNCTKFENKLESTLEHFKLHETFKVLIENLLQVAIDQAGMSEKEFLEVAKIGLESPNHKLYFEQVLSCDSFEWFKGCMIKRNLQLKEESLKLMYANKGDLVYTKDSTINKMLKDKEQIELECALAMSLAADDEKQKLYNKDDDLEVSPALVNIKYLFYFRKP
jgi:hypothetical protein